PYHFVGYRSSGIADDVRVALFQPQDLRHVQPGVHAGDHGQLACRRQGQLSFVEPARVAFVVLQQLVSYAHAFLPGTLQAKHRPLRSRPMLTLSIQIVKNGTWTTFCKVTGSTPKTT